MVPDILNTFVVVDHRMSSDDMTLACNVLQHVTPGWSATAKVYTLG